MILPKQHQLMIRKQGEDCGKLTGGTVVRVNKLVSYSGKPPKHAIVTIVTGPHKGCRVGSTNVSLYHYGRHVKEEIIAAMKADKESKMKKQHKHAELIKAWADGAEIQVMPKTIANVWIDASTPTWEESYDYRIKPNDKILYMVTDNQGYPTVASAPWPQAHQYVITIDTENNWIKSVAPL